MVRSSQTSVENATNDANDPDIDKAAAILDSIRGASTLVSISQDVQFKDAICNDSGNDGNAQGAPQDRTQTNPRPGKGCISRAAGGDFSYLPPAQVLERTDDPVEKQRQVDAWIAMRKQYGSLGVPKQSLEGLTDDQRQWRAYIQNAAAKQLSKQRDHA